MQRNSRRKAKPDRRSQQLGANGLMLFAAAVLAPAASTVAFPHSLLQQQKAHRGLTDLRSQGCALSRAVPQRAGRRRRVCRFCLSRDRDLQRLECGRWPGGPQNKQKAEWMCFGCSSWLPAAKRSSSAAKAVLICSMAGHRYRFPCL